MKRLWVLSLILCLVLFAYEACEYEEALQAEFKIVSVTQSYYEYLGEWGSAKIEYSITNTGWEYIDYYEVYFDVTCEDGAVYWYWDSGWDVPVGKTCHGYTYVDVGNREAVSAEIVDYELTNYDW